MPTVPTYQQKVLTDPLPGVRRTQGETALSEGAGVAEAEAQTSQVLAGIAGQFGHVGLDAYAGIRERERRQAEQTQELEFNNQLSNITNTILYHPETGALAVQGKYTLDLSTTTEDAYQQAVGAAAAGLPADQQERFHQLAIRHGMELSLTVHRHVAVELQKYHREALEAFLQNQEDEAVVNATDVRRVGDAIAAQVGAIKVSAPLLGGDAGTIEAKTRAVTSKTLTATIKKLIETDHNDTAQIIYDTHKTEIAGDAQGGIESALTHGAIKAEAQQLADDIITSGGTLLEQLAKAKVLTTDKKADGRTTEIRQEVEQHLKAMFSATQEAKRVAHEDTMKTIYDAIDRTKSYAAVTALQRSDLSGPERHGAQEYARYVAAGEEPATDLPTFYGLLNKANSLDPRLKNEFTKESLLAYKSVLSKVDYDHLWTIQTALRNHDDAAADGALAGFRSHEQVLKQTINQYRNAGMLDLPVAESQWNDQQRAAYAQLQRQLDREVETLELANPKKGYKASPTEIQEVLDHLLDPKTIPGQPRVFGLFPFFSTNFGLGPATTKSPLKITVKDIPKALLPDIDAGLRAADQPVNDVTRLDAYLETLYARKPKGK